MSHQSRFFLLSVTFVGTRSGRLSKLFKCFIKVFGNQKSRLKLRRTEAVCRSRLLTYTSGYICISRLSFSKVGHSPSDKEKMIVNELPKAVTAYLFVSNLWLHYEISNNTTRQHTIRPFWRITLIKNSFQDPR